MKQSAADQVISYIRERIQSGEWRSGTKISTEVKLQEATGVSKASVREAVERLCAMNILSKRQGDGTYVNDLGVGSILDQMLPFVSLGEEDLLHVLELREILEPQCVTRFIARYDPEKVQDLERLLMEADRPDTTWGKWCRADLEFHSVIAAGCGNPMMERSVDILLNVQLRLNLLRNGGEETGFRLSAEEHRDILRSILQKDGEIAAILVRRHIHSEWENHASWLAARDAGARGG